MFNIVALYLETRCDNGHKTGKVTVNWAAENVIALPGRLVCGQCGYELLIARKLDAEGNPIA